MPQNNPVIASSTVAGGLRQLVRDLAAAGIDTPELDARLLVEAATGASRESLIRDPGLPLSAPAAAQLEQLAARRLAREPVARILGTRAFYGRDFAIGQATLDPRPDTETLIEAVLELLRARGWHQRPIRIIDVGTGSGAILVTLLAELPEASGLGTDISAEALAIAAANADRHGVAERAHWHVGRSLDGIAERFDVLVSNPPYVRTAEIPTLAPEVKDHDPWSALDGGADGLAVYREIAGGLMRIVPEGLAVFEIGCGQSDAVGELLGAAAGPQPAGQPLTWRDLSGHVRCVAVETHC